MTDEPIYAPIDSEVVTDAPWPTPAPCLYCASDDEAVRAVFCNATCPGCLTRHFDKPQPKPTWRERLLAWLTGEESV